VAPVTYANECLPSQEHFTIYNRHSDLVLLVLDESAAHVQRAKGSSQPHISGIAVQVARNERIHNSSELNIEGIGLGSFNECFRCTDGRQPLCFRAQDRYQALMCRLHATRGGGMPASST
jgi:hypothetical protein